MQFILCNRGINNVRLAILISDAFTYPQWCLIPKQISNEPAVPPCSANCHIEILRFVVGKLVKKCHVVVKDILQ
jgi:hypothetical protein